MTLTVTEPLNRAPVAVDDNASVANGGSVTVPVLQNDSDPDGDTLVVSIVSGPDASLGSASVTSGQNISFQARSGQAGVASITYQVSDGELTDTAIAADHRRDLSGVAAGGERCVPRDGLSAADQREPRQLLGKR